MRPAQLAAVEAVEVVGGEVVDRDIRGGGEHHRVAGEVDPLEPGSLLGPERPRDEPEVHRPVARRGDAAARADARLHADAQRRCWPRPRGRARMASGVIAPVPAASTSGRGARTDLAVDAGGGGGSPAQAAERRRIARVRRTDGAVYRPRVTPRTAIVRVSSREPSVGWSLGGRSVACSAAARDRGHHAGRADGLGRRVPTGAGRAGWSASATAGSTCSSPGVGELWYARGELAPRKAGQLEFAQRREAAWQALRPCVVLEAVVGSRAWGLADQESDLDLRGAFALPFLWTAGLVGPPVDLVSADGSQTFWEVRKLVDQALARRPEHARASLRPLGAGDRSDRRMAARGPGGIRLETHVRELRTLRAQPAGQAVGDAAPGGAPGPGAGLARLRRQRRTSTRSRGGCRGSPPANRTVRGRTGCCRRRPTSSSCTVRSRTRG